MSGTDEVADALAMFEEFTAEAMENGVGPEILEADTGAIVPTPVEQIKAKLLSTADLANIPKPAPLIDGLLYLDSLAMLYGPSGAGKSFVGIDIAMSVATGAAWWQHNPVTAGRVLYVIAEGASGVSLRTQAWQDHHGHCGPINMDWHPGALSIFDAGWASALADVANELGPGLIVIDTFARSIVGADENSARDMGVVVQNLELIREKSGACVLLVHHSGKNSENGARGSSSLRGAMHTELELSGDTDRMELRCRKQKDTPEAEAIRLKLLPVTESAVVVEAGRVDPDELPDGVQRSLQALEEIEVETGISYSSWVHQAVSLGVSEASFKRHRKYLVDHSFVENIGTDKRPLYLVKHQI